MGLVPLSLQMLLTHARHIGGLSGNRMLELGDQQMYCHHNVPEASAAKSYFEQLGVQHTSIDLNGELGALPLDLSQRIERPEWVNGFDVVTDFGTSEHVGKGLEKLYNCRENVHRFCRPGGIMIFMNPKTGNWPGHGYHYFTMAHYLRLAPLAQYEALEVSEHPTLGNSTDGWQIHAAFRKTADNPFPSFEEFKTACVDAVFEK